jgi:hypothetical protein
VRQIPGGKSLIFALFELACSFQKPFFTICIGQTYFRAVKRFLCMCCSLRAKHSPIYTLQKGTKSVQQRSKYSARIHHTPTPTPHLSTLMTRIFASKQSSKSYRHLIKRYIIHACLLRQLEEDKPLGSNRNFRRNILKHILRPNSWTRNWDKSLPSFPPYYSRSPLTSFTPFLPPSPVKKYVL